MTKNDPRKALGKGLHSLLPPRPAAAPAATAPAPEPTPASDAAVRVIPLDRIKRNPNQPRHEFEAQAMSELTQSVGRDGIIQPIVVRPIGPNEYQIIAGERRWRAAQAANLKEIPAVVRTADDRQVMELALIENIQRQDLNPVELAMAFAGMVTELGLSHEQIGERTGKDRATVTNTLRLLSLPPEVLDHLAARRLSAGHARALLKLPDAQTQREVAELCIREGWSVRQIEEYTKPKDSSAGARGKGGKPAKEEPKLDPNVRAAVEELERKLGTRVRIVEKGADRGHLEIEYYSNDDLDRIYNAIVGQPD